MQLQIDLRQGVGVAKGQSPLLERRERLLVSYYSAVRHATCVDLSTYRDVFGEDCLKGQLKNGTYAYLAEYHKAEKQLVKCWLAVSQPFPPKPRGLQMPSSDSHLS